MLALSIAFPAGIMSQAKVAHAASATEVEAQTNDQLQKFAHTGIDTAFVAFEEYVPSGKVITMVSGFLIFSWFSPEYNNG